MVLSDAIEIVDWSRAQFALTAMYHWLFVPLTLGLSFICAIMEMAYLKSGKDLKWKKVTKFWMRIFAINFAIGVATGLILEFEFGTNWANYSYFVGDIFGAPLAIEGIIAFFMEATFIAVMFFGWDKVSDRFHLTATWMTAIGATLSAYWILVANSWMEYPVGMTFNIETARNEMVNFWDVALSPVAINKFIHSVSSGFVHSAIVVIGISAWYIIKNREEFLAKKSITIASVFGIVGSVILIWSGDGSGVQVAKVQPMKLAAMEAIYKGEKGAPLTVVSILNPKKKIDNNEPVHFMPIKIDKVLSILAFHDKDSYVPGVEDLVYGNDSLNIISVEDKIVRGRTAINKLKELSQARKDGNKLMESTIMALFDRNSVTGEIFYDKYFKYFGYGFLKSPQDVIPNIPLVYYSFRIMVALGMLFLIIFITALILSKRDTLDKRKWLLWIFVWSIPLVYMAGQAGWVVCEVGRQPWTVQDMLPTIASVSSIDATSVKVTFFIFAILFTALLTAEISIMLKQIKKGSENIF